ncbi:MAG TPA: polyprenyl diphosphate synthase [Candidatus Baltobacteraceae bacterium]
MTQAPASSLDPARIPKHVAIIMDGNRRWARRRNLPVAEGHRRGMVALRRITRAAQDLGIEALTVYGFSTENWKRDHTEISLLLDLAVYFAQNELSELNRNNVRVVVIGHYEALPRASRDALTRLVELTANNTGLLLNLAVNYSSRMELGDAVAALAAEVEAGRLDPEQIDEARLQSYLFTADLPDPELLIRPGGEERVSNFLLYQLAHAEVYVCDVLWPDFDADELRRALAEYQRRRLRA